VVLAAPGRGQSPAICWTNVHACQKAGISGMSTHAEDGLVGSIATLAILLLSGPVTDKAFGSTARLKRRANA
jgi:hypothetical protein